MWRPTQKFQRDFKITTTIITIHHAILAGNIDSQKSAKNSKDTLLYDENCRRKSKAMATTGNDVVQIKIVINVKITEYTKQNCFRDIWVWVISDCLACRVQLKCDGTLWRTGGEVKGKLANRVGCQYPSHYLGTWCVQHYYRWCAHLGCQ